MARTVLEWPNGERATVLNGKWTGDNPHLVMLAQAVQPLRIEGYEPDPDYAQAQRAAAALDGVRIVKFTKPRPMDTSNGIP